MYGKIEKLFKMKRYRLIYVPTGREDREWIFIYAANKEAAIRKADEHGVIIDIILDEENIKADE
tara:strand:- start:168 stop:359 length:192 start_codon:yes stop_codon:yes gene_type:complete